VQDELVTSRVALRMEPASALPIILADKIQLQQVILNLVINGIEAMQSGGISRLPQMPNTS
jgi:C4-dicarboxylate-specific signal transduction histidine kinase